MTVGKWYSAGFTGHDDHVVEFGQFHQDGNVTASRFLARCTCGWKVTTESDYAAVAQANAHVAVNAKPITLDGDS